jgi:hypothetical protein
MFDCNHVSFRLGSGRRSSCVLEIKQVADGRGQGLFTVDGVERGVDLAWFDGEVLRRRGLEVSGGLDFSKVIMVEPGRFLRARVGGEMSLAWFANHTCSGANARIVVVGSGDEVCAVLRAARELRAGEEIVVDYCLSSLRGGKLERRDWHFECLCLFCRK